MIALGKQKTSALREREVTLKDKKGPVHWFIFQTESLCSSTDLGMTRCIVMNTTQTGYRALKVKTVLLLGSGPRHLTFSKKMAVCLSIRELIEVDFFVIRGKLKKWIKRLF
jgi:6-phosphogluconolactonase (cycloisomerase 2 family)